MLGLRGVAKRRHAEQADSHPEQSALTAIDMDAHAALACTPIASWISTSCAVCKTKTAMQQIYAGVSVYFSVNANAHGACAPFLLSVHANANAHGACAPFLLCVHALLVSAYFRRTLVPRVPFGVCFSIFTQATPVYHLDTQLAQNHVGETALTSCQHQFFAPWFGPRAPPPHKYGLPKLREV